MPAHVHSVDFVLLDRHPFRVPRRKTPHDALEAAPAGLLPFVPWAPAAHDVFTPEELAGRVAAIGARVAAADPDAAAGRGPAMSCWACGGRPTPGRGAWAGWVRRPVPDLAEETECYCPGCFERWGWPEEYGRVKTA